MRKDDLIAMVEKYGDNPAAYWRDRGKKRPGVLPNDPWYCSWCGEDFPLMDKEAFDRHRIFHLRNRLYSAYRKARQW